MCCVWQQVLHAVQDVGMCWGDVRAMLLTSARGSFFWDANGTTEAEKAAWVADFDARVDSALARVGRL